MTLRSGVDLLEIQRLKDVIARHGERFLQRIYTQAEREICQANPASLAARFAAKEAVSKALGTGIGQIAWTEIEILRDQAGAPLLHLVGQAAARAETLGLRQWSISLSHTHAHAIALVVASD